MSAAGVTVANTEMALFEWLHQAGTPEVTVYDKYDAASRRYTLTLSQRTPPTPGQPDKQPLVIPVAMGLLNSGGQQIAARMLMLTEAEQSFTFDDVAAPPVPSLLRGFSAPVRLAERFVAGSSCWERILPALKSATMTGRCRSPSIRCFGIRR